jgi:hypothetical protein
MRRSLYQLTFALGAAFMIAGCANPPGPVSGNQDMLADAGFVPKKANNPTRLAMLKSLPPHQFVSRTVNGRTRYLYADPMACGCIYVGDQIAYDRYRQEMAAQQTATDAQIRAILSSAPLPGEEGL